MGPVVPADHVQGNRRVILVVIKDIAQGSIIRDDQIQERAIGPSNLSTDLVLCRNYAVGRRASYDMQRGQIMAEHDLIPYRSLITPGKCQQSTFVRAKHNIQAGTVIQSADVVQGSISAFNARGDWIPRIELAVGCKTKQAIPSGQIVTEASLANKRSPDYGSNP